MFGSEFRLMASERMELKESHAFAHPASQGGTLCAADPAVGATKILFGNSQLGA
jgi:hypothetical protein